MMGGQVGISDHVTIGAGAMLGAQSGYMSNVPAGARWIGSPAQPVRDFMKGVAVLRRLVRNAGKPDGEEAMTGGEPRHCRHSRHPAAVAASLSVPHDRSRHRDAR